MANHAAEWRIKAPNRNRRTWAIVVTTVDELGRVTMTGQGATYDDAVAQIRVLAEARQKRLADHMAQVSRDYAVLGQLSASNFDEEEG